MLAVIIRFSSWWFPWCLADKGHFVNIVTLLTAQVQTVQLRVCAKHPVWNSTRLGRCQSFVHPWRGFWARVTDWSFWQRPRAVNLLMTVLPCRALALSGC